MTAMAARQDELWTVRRVLGWTTSFFEKNHIDSPRLTAEILLAHSLNCDRVRLYVEWDRPLKKEELTLFRGLIERRSVGVPTQYLTGEKEFYNRRFEVDARVLIPRPETELLVEAVLGQIPKDLPRHVLDVCTGSGCIAVTVACERPLASVWATDASAQALEVASVNAQRLRVEERVTFLEGDLLSPLPEGQQFDIVVSNPPYVKTEDIPNLSREVRQEPSLALDGGADGLQLYRRLIPSAMAHLKPNGLLALEIGEDQGASVLELLMSAGYHHCRIEKDFSRLNRFAFGQRL